MDARIQSLPLLAAVLEYPDQRTAGLARRAADLLAGDHVGLSGALWDLAVWLENTPWGEIEERYTGLFDLNPVATLNLGFHVFGDTYQRGEFLAGLAGELRRRGLEPGLDLPDYLPTVLRLLGRIEPLEEAGLLLSVGVLPGLAKIGESLKDSRDPWSRLLRALPDLLAELCPLTPPLAVLSHSPEASAHA